MEGLQPISEILSTTPEDSTSEDLFANAITVYSDDPRYAGQEKTPAPVICEYCGAKRRTMGRIIFGRLCWNVIGAEPCTCPGAIAEREQKDAEKHAKEEAAVQDEMRRRISRIIGESGMGERFLRRTFETFRVTSDNRKAADTAQKYAQNFDRLLPKKGEPEPGRNGLFIAGPPGTGKTHIAAAIANHLIAQGRPVVCMTMIDLLERIKRTYSKAGENEGSVLNLYKTVPLLVIDDIGKEPPTEWAISTIYNIINGRYEAYLPTIVTTNYSTDDLIARMTPRDTHDATTARATIDRLMEMCRGVTLTGESWRSK